MKYFVLIGIAFPLVFLGCKKTIHENIHENKVIEGNLVPYDNYVSTIQINNYINKLYVDLLGREPDATELSAAYNQLKLDSLSLQSKQQLVSSLINTPLFYEQFFLKTSASLLNGISKTDIYNELLFRDYLLNFYQSIGDTLTYNSILVEKVGLTELYACDSLYRVHQIDISAYFRRFINNYFYDQVNMGSENYVKASFENLLYRLPTNTELQEGIAMVDGFGVHSLFLMSGNNKGDFQTIITNNTSFYQGLIFLTYLSYLNRKPTDADIIYHLNNLITTKNYELLITKVLVSKEYAGF